MSGRMRKLECEYNDVVPRRDLDEVKEKYKILEKEQEELIATYKDTRRKLETYSSKMVITPCCLIMLFITVYISINNTGQLYIPKLGLNSWLRSPLG